MNNKIQIIIFLFLLVMSVGCTSFLPIETNNVEDIKNHENLIIDFKNGNILKINNVKRAKITSENKLNIYKYNGMGDNVDSLTQIYSLDEIKSIRTKRFDFGKTFFTVFLGVPAAAIVVLAILCHGDCSVGW